VTGIKRSAGGAGIVSGTESHWNPYTRQTVEYE